jgi:hypothetical protein
MVRCAQCHATVPIPDHLEARTMQCAYCGAVQAVPDLQARERALIERQRQEQLAYQLEQEAYSRREEAMREAAREAEQRKERKRGVRWGMVTTLFSLLLAPVILSITIFDLPARLGLGEDGSDRLALIAEQLGEGGCTPLSPSTSTYTRSTVTRLVKLERGCLRVLAAGGPDHDDLTVRLFDVEGKEVARSTASRDPQLKYCVSAPASLRYEVAPGMMDKGRLTHLALACPAAAPAEGEAGAAAGAPEPAAPADRRGKKPHK